MPRKKSHKRNIRKLTKMGGGRSMGLTLPIEMLRKLGWRERQKVTVRLYSKKIIIEDWKK